MPHIVQNALGLALLAAVVTGCGLGNEPVSHEEAVAGVEAAVDRVADGDPSGLCTVASSELNCEQQIRDVEPGSVPTTRPEVICSYPLSSDSRSRVVAIEGTTGEGEGFRSLVIVDPGPKVVNPVFWHEISVAYNDEPAGSPADIHSLCESAGAHKS